jgi:hypothetical protein
MAPKGDVKWTMENKFIHKIFSKSTSNKYSSLFAFLEPEQCLKRWWNLQVPESFARSGKYKQDK